MRLSGKTGQQDLLVRAKAYALRIIRLYVALPKNQVAQVIGKQVLRSGTSVGAHLAEAGHAKSKADFFSKVEGALQELEETRYWLELLIEAKTITDAKLRPLLSETAELIAILVTIARRTENSMKTPAK